MIPVIGVSWDFLTPRNRERILHNPQGCPVRFLSVPPTREEIEECDILFGMFPPDLLKGAKRLKWLQTPCAGVEQFAHKELYAGPVALTNATGAYGTAISEHLLTLTLMLFRRMGEYYERQQKQQWGLIGQVRPVFGAVATVVGLGNIGSAYAKKMNALGAVVRGVRRQAGEKPDYLDRLYSSQELDQALDGADIVALCLPGTPNTTGILSADRIDRLKKGCIILNIGRGSAIDQDALIRALNDGSLGGAGLDVMTPEPLPKGHPLWSAQNLILTPHVSGQNSMELTLDQIVTLFLKNLAHYAAGEPFEHEVDWELGY